MGRIRTRRVFLGSALGTCGLLYAPFALRSGFGGRADDAPAHSVRQLLEEQFANLDHVRTVGRLYLQAKHRQSADPRKERDLARLIRARRPRTATEMRDLLGELIRRDFEGGDVVVVDRWFLARTEAEACSLLVA